MNQTRLALTSILPFRATSGAMIVWALTATLAVAGQVTGSWTQRAKLTPETPSLNEQYGNAVAIGDDWVVVGAARDSSPNYWGGSVYFYPRTGDGVAAHTRLLASDARSSDLFGSAVDVDGSWAVVGAVQAGINVNNSGDYGGVYFFKHAYDAWIEVGRVNAADYGQGDGFGGAVAIDGDRCIVGSHWDDHSGYTDAGSAYILQRSGDSWNQVAKLQAHDPATNNHYGISVAIDGDRALVGAYFNSHAGGDYAGAAYLYEQSGGTWNQVAKLTADDAHEGDYFGVSVAMDGDRALIGAERADVGGETMAGSAYVFEWLGGSWQQTAKLVAADAAASENFGVSAVLEGDRALIGSQFDNDGRGAAYVFELSGDAWSQVAKLTAGDGQAGDLFGYSIDLAGKWAVAGARLDDHSGHSKVGSAYVFAVPEPSSLILLSTGVVGLLAYVRVRTRRKSVRFFL